MGLWFRVDFSKGNFFFKIKWDVLGKYGFVKLVRIKGCRVKSFYSYGFRFYFRDYREVIYFMFFYLLYVDLVLVFRFFRVVKRILLFYTEGYFFYLR